MSHIDKKMVKQLSKLCRIACTEEQEDSLLHDMEEILSYMEQLNDLDTDDVSPCNYVNLSLSQTPLRKDVVGETLPIEEFLKGAPQRIGSMIRVPSIMKQE